MHHYCHHRCGGVVSPYDFVAGATKRGPPAVLGCLLRCLQDGAAVLHRCRLSRLLVLGHDSAGLVWAKAIGEIRVGDPRRSTGRTWTVCCCSFSCSIGAWARKKNKKKTGRCVLELQHLEKLGCDFESFHNVRWTLLCNICTLARCTLWQFCTSVCWCWCSCIDT